MQPLPLLAFAALLAAPLAGCAPRPPPPVCGQPEVLTLLTERLGRAGRGQIIEPGSVNQREGEAPGLVRCAVRVQTATYDLGRLGPVPTPAPIITITIVQYAVELRKNGVFLLPEPPGQAGVARRSM